MKTGELSRCFSMGVGPNGSQHRQGIGASCFDDRSRLSAPLRRAASSLASLVGFFGGESRRTRFLFSRFDVSGRERGNCGLGCK